MTRPRRAIGVPVPVSAFELPSWLAEGDTYMTDKDKAFVEVIDLLASKAVPRWRDRFEAWRSKLLGYPSTWEINQKYIRQYASIRSKRGVLACAAGLHMDLEKVEAYYTLIYG